jgi:hypothetical protein
LCKIFLNILFFNSSCKIKEGDGEVVVVIVKKIVIKEKKMMVVIKIVG